MAKQPSPTLLCASLASAFPKGDPSGDALGAVRVAGQADDIRREVVDEMAPPTATVARALQLIVEHDFSGSRCPRAMTSRQAFSGSRLIGDGLVGRRLRTQCHGSRHLQGTEHHHKS
jgi:hypothetical protein